jgi:antirestriction protein ArdC
MATNKEIKTELLGKLRALSAEIITDPEKLKAYAKKWTNGFHNYSLFNLLLIMSQRPEAELCAGFNQWKAKGRHVKQGEHALWILAPGFAKKEPKRADQEPESQEEKIIKYFFAVPVFDVGQTDGAPVELGNRDVKRTEGDLTLDTLAALFPFPLKINNGMEDGSTDGKTVNVSRRENEAQMIAAYLHELSHCYLHHDETRNDLSAPGRAFRELEAEACAFAVGAVLGIDNQGSKFYLGHWGADREKVEGSSMRILSAAEKILSKIKDANLI